VKLCGVIACTREEERRLLRAGLFQ